MPQDDAVMEFVMDAAYCREFHQEWVDSVGHGWRVDRVMIPAFGFTAVLVAVGAVLSNVFELLYVAGGLLLVSGFEAWNRSRRRATWLEYCRTLPWFGKTLRIVLRGGDLIQEKNFAGDPRFARTGEILPTPNGYLVRYEAVPSIDVPNNAISALRASVYIPHRTISPLMSRAEFAKLNYVIED
jgi:hypothetical protein